MEATYDQIREGIGNLKPKDYTAGGLPKMSALNNLLARLGFGKITAEQRDEAMAGRIDPNPVPLVTVTEANCDPVIVQLQGRRQWRLRVGVAQHVPEAVCDALRAAGVTFKTEEG